MVFEGKRSETHGNSRHFPDSSVNNNKSIPWKSWYILGVLSFLYMNSVIDRFLMSIAVPSIKTDLNLTDLQISFLVGPAFVIFYIMFGLPFGALADKTSRRNLIAGGVALWSVFATMCGLARTFAVLFFARMGVGAGEAALAPASYSIMSDIFPRHRLTTATSIFVASASVGSAVALFLGGWLLELGRSMEHIDWPLLGYLRDWQFLFIVTGVPGLVFALLVFTFREPVRKKMGGTEAQIQGSFSDLWKFLKYRRSVYIPLFIGFSIASCLVYGLMGWLPTLFFRRFSLDPGQVGAIFGTLVAVTAILSYIIKGLLVDYFFAKGVKDIHFRMYIYCSLISGPIGIATFFTESLVLFSIGLFIILSILKPSLGYSAAALQLVTPNILRGKMSSLFILLITGVGFSLGPIFVALFTDIVYQDEASLNLSLASLVGVCVPAAVAVLWMGCRPLREAIEDSERSIKN